MNSIRQWLPVLSTAAIAACSVALMYRHGAGLSTDTIAYFGFAHSHALSDLPVHHGVFYALLIGMFSATGLSVPVAAGVVNILAAVICATTLYGILRRVLVTDRYWPAIGATLLILFSLAWLDSFAYAMSEPVFYATLLTATYFLLCALSDVNNKRFIWLSAGCVALSTLTRYAGVCFVAVFAATLWAANSFRWRGFKQCCLYGSIALIPIVTIMVRNRIHHGSTTNRELLLTGIPLQNLAEGSMNIASWFVPFQFLLQWPWLHVAVTTAFLLFIVLITAKSACSRKWHVFLLGFAATGYALFFIFVSATVDLGAFNQRKLSPIFVFGFLAIIAWSGNTALQRHRAFRILLATTTMYLSLFTAYRAVSYIQESYTYGRGFSAITWEEGILLESIHRLRSVAPVYSNADDAYILRTGHAIQGIPRRFIRTTTRPVDSFPREYERMQHAFQEQQAILWHSNLRYWPPYLVPPENLIADFDLVPILKEATGTIYTHRPNQEYYQRSLDPLR
jgi:hypothetical protein